VIAFSRHRDLERHFSGEGSPSVDRRLFHHMRGCERCRAQYRTLSLLESLEAEGAARARERLARGLFEQPAPRRLLVSTGLATAFACVALVFSVSRTPTPFRARGGQGVLQAPGPSLAIYRVPRDQDNPQLPAIGDTQRAGNLMHAGESLAFSYVNPAGLGTCCLMVLGRDAAGHVYWFWPAWDNAADDPSSLPVSESAQPVELREAVRHPLQPGELTIVGLFTPRPLHVREVEEAVAKGLGGLQAFEGHVWTETLEVSP
jgi:hypothetical protein